MYALGVDDGLRDTDLVRAGGKPRGPQPPFPKYAVMYTQGYEEAFDPAAAEDEASHRAYVGRASRRPGRGHPGRVQDRHVVPARHARKDRGVGAPRPNQAVQAAAMSWRGRPWCRGRAPDARRREVMKQPTVPKLQACN
jgi:hypothetical protein